MKKNIKLNESKLINIIKRVIEEQTIDKKSLVNLAKSNKKKVIDYFIDWYNSPQTKLKFKNKSNIKKVSEYVPKIKIKVYWTKETSPNPDSLGWVNRKVEYIVNLNMYKLTQGDQMYNTMYHETAHLIDFYLQKLGENTITTSTEGYYNIEGGKDDYVDNEAETFVRIQRLRTMLGIGALESVESISNKIVNAIKQKKLTFGNYRIQISKDKKTLILSKKVAEKGTLTDLWGFYSILRINNEKQDDIAALFANFSKVVSGKVYLDLSKIANVNYNTKAALNN